MLGPDNVLRMPADAGQADRDQRDRVALGGHHAWDLLGTPDRAAGPENMNKSPISQMVGSLKEEAGPCPLADNAAGKATHANASRDPLFAPLIVALDRAGENHFMSPTRGTGSYSGRRGG